MRRLRFQSGQLHPAAMAGRFFRIWALTAALILVGVPWAQAQIWSPVPAEPGARLGDPLSLTDGTCCQQTPVAKSKVSHPSPSRRPLPAHNAGGQHV